MTVNVTPLEVPFAFVTVIELVPAPTREPLGIVAVRVVELTKAVLRDVTPKKAVDGLMKPVPVSVIGVLPAPACADDGEMLVSVGTGGGGAAVIVNVRELERALASLTTIVVVPAPVT